MQAARTYKIVEFDCGHSLVDTRDDFLCDSSGVDMFRIQSITQSRHSCSDLVELDAFFASISLVDEHDCAGVKGVGEGIMVL